MENKDNLTSSTNDKLKCLCKSNWSNYNFTIFLLLHLFYPPTSWKLWWKSHPVFPFPLRSASVPITSYTEAHLINQNSVCLYCAVTSKKCFVNLTAGFISTWCGTVCLHKLCWQIGILYTYLEQLVFSNIGWLFWVRSSPEESHSVINMLHGLFTCVLREFPVRPQRHQCSWMFSWLITCTTGPFPSCPQFACCQQIHKEDLCE